MNSASFPIEPAAAGPWSSTPRAIADIMACAAVGVLAAHCPATCTAAAGATAQTNSATPAAPTDGMPANCVEAETLSSPHIAIPLADESLEAAVRAIPQSGRTRQSSPTAASGCVHQSSPTAALDHAPQPSYATTADRACRFPVVLLQRDGVENAMMHARKAMREDAESAPLEARGASDIAQALDSRRASNVSAARISPRASKTADPFEAPSGTDAPEASASPQFPYLWDMLKDSLQKRESPDKAALRVAEALMDPACGVAALLLSVRMSYGVIGKQLRTHLLERNLVDAVIEMDAEALKAHTYGNVLWLLRANRTEDEGVLLAQLSGDGFAAIDGEPKFYESLAAPATASPAGAAILDLCINRNEIPLVSTRINRGRILADRECSLRFSSYADSVDLQKSLSQESDAWQAARSEMQSRAHELEERIRAFHAALDALA